MKTKILFLAVSALLLLVPMLATNTKPNQISELDNAYLPEFPALQFVGFRSGMEKYVADRIGFRAEMITAYQIFCDRAFQKLTHPSYTYGKEGYIWMADLVTYQHLDVSEEYVEDFADYVGSLRDLCQGRGTEFLFYLCPNKETVYPEYFPDGCNIKDQPNRTDRILERLDEKGVTYLYPKELFLSLKEEEQLYNVKYDAGHWNQNGAFYGHQQIVHYLNGIFPEMKELERDEFEVTQRLAPYLISSKFRIDEMVPQYDLADTDAVLDQGIFDEIAVIASNNYHMRYQNETALERGAPKVLIFGDSYFGGSSAEFYINHCGEVVMLHAENMPNAEYYISVFQPDVVIYEVVERQLLSTWDNFKREKRCYDLDAAMNDEGLSARRILIDADLAALKAEAVDREIVSLSGNLGEAAVTDPSGVLALKAVLNGKEYDPVFDRDDLSYRFSFRAEDITAASGISFFALWETKE